MPEAQDDKRNGALTAAVSHLVKECESYREELSIDRDKAQEYFDGKMDDVPVIDGRSKVVSRDVRSQIKKVLPSLIRTILGNDQVAEFQPMGEGDEEYADQASDFISNVVFPESDGYEAVEDAIHDALKLRNGIIRWWREKKDSVQVTQHTGLDEMALVQLISDDDVTVLEQDQRIEIVDVEGQGPTPSTVYDVKIRKRFTNGRTRLGAVPPEQLLIHPDALCIEESPLTGINIRQRRSDLVAMGYDRDLVDSLPIAGTTSDQDDEESTRRRDLINDDNATAAKAMQEVEYYELYVRYDADDDGIAELRRLIYAGAIKEEYLLENEEWDDVPFADIISERRPHQREGSSVADDTMEGQKVKTVLLRETLDNIYWQNKPQPIVDEQAISNPDAVLNPAFGKPIRVSAGTDVRAALGFTQVPFVGSQSFQMLDYFDRDMADVTGISDASGGLAPDALQNVTAKASSMVEQAGIAQTELMARTIARGLIPVFKGLLKLTIKHQDKPRTVRLRKKWVTFDPKPWNSGMDVIVNTGLGAGTRERDMMMMQMIVGLQEKLLSQLGPINNPFVSPKNVFNALTKLVQASGMRATAQFFTEPTEDQINKLIAQQSNQPNPEMEKLKQQQAKAEMEATIEREKIQSNERIEMAKMQQEFELKRYQIDQEIQLKQRQNVAQALTGQNVTSVQLGGMPG
ncbi:phage portal protein [Agrobacterium sp. OT33]|uniref:portal protein n=1 Tax=Agrobacterium sp. OT33 TaxID=2815338 RepID=UPI001A8CACC3|nr:phage portal protein [Agrobacterium sp. OT33]MBO0125115.1 phage portal protein [Agrobacterium sp. OT33]